MSMREGASYERPLMHNISDLRRALQEHLCVLIVHGRSHGGTVFSRGLLLKVPTFMRIKHQVILNETISLQISNTTSLCLLTIRPWMYRLWHLRSMCGHVSKSVELQIEHVLDGNRAASKERFLQKVSIY